MLPTDEEKKRINEAQNSNPDMSLGPAEQFLQTMDSIADLPARLQTWTYKLDYDLIEAVSTPLSHRVARGGGDIWFE